MSSDEVHLDDVGYLKTYRRKRRPPSERKTKPQEVLGDGPVGHTRGHDGVVDTNTGIAHEHEIGNRLKCHIVRRVMGRTKPRQTWNLVTDSRPVQAADQC